MKKETMAIRFRRRYRGFEAGDTYDGYPVGIAKTLVQMRIADAVEIPGVVTEKAVTDPPRDKAIRRAKRVK